TVPVAGSWTMVMVSAGVNSAGFLATVTSRTVFSIPPELPWVLAPVPPPKWQYEQSDMRLNMMKCRPSLFGKVARVGCPVGEFPWQDMQFGSVAGLKFRWQARQLGGVPLATG